MTTEEFILSCIIKLSESPHDLNCRRTLNEMDFSNNDIFWLERMIYLRYNITIDVKKTDNIETIKMKIDEILSSKKNS